MVAYRSKFWISAKKYGTALNYRHLCRTPWISRISATNKNTMIVQLTRVTGRWAGKNFDRRPGRALKRNHRIAWLQPRAATAPSCNGLSRMSRWVYINISGYRCCCCCCSNSGADDNVLAGRRKSRLGSLNYSTGTWLTTQPITFQQLTVAPPPPFFPVCRFAYDIRNYETSVGEPSLRSINQSTLISWATAQARSVLTTLHQCQPGSLAQTTY